MFDSKFHSPIYLLHEHKNHCRFISTCFGRFKLQKPPIWRERRREKTSQIPTFILKIIQNEHTPFS